MSLFRATVAVSQRTGGRGFGALPMGAKIMLVGVEAMAAELTMVLALRCAIGHRDLVLAVILTGLGVFTAECTRRVEQMRQRPADRPNVNLTSVWTMPAAVLLPPLLAAITVTTLYVHLWARSGRHADPVYRLAFNVSVVVLSCDAAAAVAHWGPLGFTLWPAGPKMVGAMLVVIACYSVVNSGLTAGALILLRDDRSTAGAWGRWLENCVEYAALCLGMVAAVLVKSLLWLLVLLLLPLYVLYWAILVRQLHAAATTDEKTGLSNAGTWQTLLDQELERAGELTIPVGVLMIDLDPVRRVDERGRVDGDAALRAVADAISDEVSVADMCGRHGGDEFVVALPGVDLDGATAVGERIRDRVRALRLADSTGHPSRLTVSIGVAAFPDAGSTAEAVVLAADTALYAAKDGGRDRVSVARVGAAPDVPRPPARVERSDSAR